MSTPQILPPRVSFVDPRTGTIAREWFLWLMNQNRSISDTEALAMISAFDASAAAMTKALEAKVAEARMAATTPKPTIDAAARQQTSDVAVWAEFRRQQSALAELGKALADLERRWQPGARLGQMQRDMDAIAITEATRRAAQGQMAKDLDALAIMEATRQRGTERVTANGIAARVLAGL